MVRKTAWGTKVAAVLAAGLLVSCGNQAAETPSDVKIIGGENVPAGQGDLRELATVALTTDIVGSSGQSLLDDGHSFCSGTIIGPKLILTAAHCLQKFDPETRQKLDEFVLPNESDFLINLDNQVARSGSWMRAAHVIPHPDWSPSETLSPQPSSPPNDIGLVVLEEEIPSDRLIAPLAPLDVTIGEGDTAHLVGFGVTRSRDENDTGTKRQVSVPVGSADAASQRITVGELFRGACAGDSGGPAYIDIDGKMFVMGATSTGAELFGQCLGMMNNYTDARYYGDWIQAEADAHAVEF